MGGMFDRLLDALANPQLVWIVLQVGLVLLSGTLITLALTRWGQSRPLRKCVVLSLWAHLLLAIYLATIDIMPGGPGNGFGPPVHVALNDWLVASDDIPTGDREAPRDVEPEDAQTERPPNSPLDTIPPESTPVADASGSPEPPKPDLLATPAPPPIAESLLTPPSALPRLSDLPPTQAPELTQQTPETSPQPTETVPLSASAVDAISAVLRHAPAPTLPEPVMPAITVKAPVADASGSPSTQPSTTNPQTPAYVPPAIYGLRFSKERVRAASERGGSAQTEAAVENALKWLATQQLPDGRWDALQTGGGREVRTFGQDRQGAGARADTAITGLAVLAFLGAGHTPSHGPYADHVSRGVQFIVKQQATDGNLAGQAGVFAFMYSHGIATLAVSEAYAISGDASLREPVRHAIGYTLRSQNPATGGWRYRPQDRGDTSQFGWQLMGLKSAELAGIEIPQQSRDGMRRFLASVTFGQQGGLACYRPNERASRSMTAEALVCRQFLGMPAGHPAGEEAASFVIQEPPGNTSSNMYFWYYATLGLYQQQGPYWTRWNESLTKTLVSSQRSDGGMAGSWDPDPVWGGYGGRAFSTALGALCLEVYYRYLPVYVESAQSPRPAR